MEVIDTLAHLNGRGRLLRRTLRCGATTMWTAVSALSLSWRRDFTGFAFYFRERCSNELAIHLNLPPKQSSMG